MIIEKRLFPAQEKDERILLILRRHWFTYAIFWFVTILLLIPLMVFFSYTINNSGLIAESIQNISILVCSIYILFIFTLLINGFVDFYLDVYIITDRRIVDIVQNGLFKREISELNLRMIQDVSAHVDGIFPTFLHYGNINVQTAAETPNFAFKNIPHPYEISKKILDLHEAYIKRGKPDNKIFKSTILEDFGSEQCYSKESCDKVLLKNVNNEEEQKRINPIIEEEPKKEIKKEKTQPRVDRSLTGVKKSKKAFLRSKVVRVKKEENKYKVKEVNIDGISLVTVIKAKITDEEGKLEEGKEVDLK